MVRLSAGEKKRKLIIDTCKKLFYRKGYANTTYEDICKAADIPPGTITYHFKGKRDIAAVIDAEYEAQNKIYIEKMCGDVYSKTQLMVIENYHMWKRNFEERNLYRFLYEITRERLPNQSAYDVVKYYYQCVIDDQGVRGITEKDLDLIVPTQLGMSESLLITMSRRSDYTYEDMAEFGIRFFLRQLGLSDKKIHSLTLEGKELFDGLPIDNRYYAEFAYDDRYVTQIGNDVVDVNSVIGS